MISEKSDSANDQSPVQSRSGVSSGARWYGDTRHTDDDNGRPDYILPRSTKNSTSGESDTNDDDHHVGDSTHEADADEHLTDKVFCGTISETTIHTLNTDLAH